MSTAMAPAPTASPAPAPEPTASTTPKIRHLRVEGFRGFKQFEMSDLGRVNLLVGPNNGGKTSLLEAVHSLASVDQNMMLAGINRRGGKQRGGSPEGIASFESYAFVSNLFHGYSPSFERGFRIVADGYRELRSTLVAANQLNGTMQTSNNGDSFANAHFETEWKCTNSLGTRSSNRVESLDGELAVRVSGQYFDARQLARSRPVFIGARSIEPNDAVRLLSAAVLTSDEDRLLDALQIIDPRIERIAFSGGFRFLPDENARGILVRLKGGTDRLPIGYLGEGVWQMLGIALSLVYAKGSCLLVDDIDTGLHYSVLEQMWKLINETAKALDVQVFATTHSRDCVTSLASICRDDVDEGSEVTIQRIEPDDERSIAYAEQEIVSLANFGGEVR